MWPEGAYRGTVVWVRRLAPEFPGWLEVGYWSEETGPMSAHVPVIERTIGAGDQLELRRDPTWAFRVNGCPWIPMGPCVPCGESEQSKESEEG